MEDGDTNTPVELFSDDLSRAISIPENASQSVAEYPKGNHQRDSHVPEGDPLRSQESSGEENLEEDATENSSQSLDEYPSNHHGGSHVPDEDLLRSQESSGEQDCEKGAMETTNTQVIIKHTVTCQKKIH